MGAFKVETKTQTRLCHFLRAVVKFHERVLQVFRDHGKEHCRPPPTGARVLLDANPAGQAVRAGREREEDSEECDGHSETDMQHAGGTWGSYLDSVLSWEPM